MRWRAGSWCRRATTVGTGRRGDGVFNAAAIASYTRRLADRIERHVRAGELPVVLGGDCSIQLGASPALRVDPSVMPAVDSPDPDGLLPDELTALLGPLVRSPHCVDLDITIYDPDLDPEGTAGALLTDIVVNAFAGATPTG